MIESGNLSLPNEDDDSVDEVSEAGEEGENMDGAKLSVTQFDDPLSGGHFAGGASKAPLGREMGRDERGRSCCVKKVKEMEIKNSPRVRQRT